MNKAKSGSDKAIVSLTVVSLGVLCVQTVIGKSTCMGFSSYVSNHVLGLGSMNCEVPHNDLDGDRFTAFGVVIALAVVVITVYLSVVRYWWTQARGRRLNM